MRALVPQAVVMKAAKMPSVEEASQVFLKSKQDQLGYLIQATLRIEKGLATLTQNQESLERVTETKFYDLDLKVTKMQTAIEQLQEEAEERKGKSTTDALQRVPRGSPETATYVKQFADSPDDLFETFVQGMGRMGQLDLNPDGNVRLNCRLLN